MTAPAPDGLAVVELGHLGQPEPSPQPEEAPGHLRLLLGAKDLDPSPAPVQVHRIEDREGTAPSR